MAGTATDDRFGPRDSAHEALTRLESELGGPGAREVTSLFLDAADRRLPEMAAALEKADAETLRYATHDLRGGAAIMHLERLSALLAELEGSLRQGDWAPVAALVELAGEDFASIRPVLDQYAGR